MGHREVGSARTQEGAAGAQDGETGPSQGPRSPAPPGTTGPGNADAGRDRWGPQSAAARSPRAAAPEHDFRGQHGRTKASMSLHVGTASLDKAGRALPHCAAWPVFAGSEAGHVPSPLSPACPPPDLQDTRARPCWPGPMLWGALLGVSLQTTGRFSSWESGRWGVRFRAFSV